MPRKICGKPCCSCFKPEGSLKGDLAGVRLGTDELEAIKLHEVEELSQKDCAASMEISQPTFARILASARKKIASAIVNGEKINIDK